MHERAGHLLDDLGQLGMRMAEHHAHHAGGQVVVLLVVHIDELDALARLENDAGAVAPAEHRLGIACLEIGMRVRKPKGLFHGGVASCPGDVCPTLRSMHASLIAIS